MPRWYAGAWNIDRTRLEGGRSKEASGLKLPGGGGMVAMVALAGRRYRSYIMYATIQTYPYTTRVRKGSPVYHMPASLALNVFAVLPADARASAS
jgi:hypothetical protein